MLASIGSDLRLAVRSLARRPLFSLILILILGIGLGANAAMFSIVDSVLLEPLPYPDPGRLAWVWGRTPGGRNNTISAVDYKDYQAASTAFEELAAYGTFPERYVITGADEPEVVVGAVASGNMFRALEVGPALGRGFVPEDEAEAAGDPVVLSHGLWQRRFGGDPQILGRAIVLDGRSYEVIGVMPAEFAFPSWAELWRPLRMTEQLARGRGNRNFLVFGRLKPDVTLQRAESEMVAIASGIAETFPDVNEGWSVEVIELREVFVGGARRVLYLLMGAVGLVLLVACANVAALLLARATGREGEVAVRVALGASRVRIARQLLTESVVIALIGGLLGIGIAYGALAALKTLGGTSLPRLAGVGIDGTALLFTLLVSTATGLLFGAAPALRASRPDLVESLKEGHRGQRRAGGMRLQGALVVGQVALSLMLLIGSGLLMRSFLQVRRVDLGFDPSGVVTARLRLPAVKYGQDNPPELFYLEAMERVGALPGVEAVGVVTSLPVIGGFGPWNYVEAEGRPPASAADRQGAVRRFVSASYFEAMGIPLLRGRTFSRRDTRLAPPVMVISRSMAEMLFPGEDPLGRKVVLPWDPPVYFEVVGVVADVRLGPLESDSRPTMYWALTQSGGLNNYLVVRARGDDPAVLAPSLRSAIWSVDSDVPVANFRTMDQLVSSSLASNRFRTLLLGTFAGVALLLAAMGLYGVLSQLVGRRKHEVGVRVALGADRDRVMMWVLNHGMKLTGFGLLLGLAGAAATTRVARGVLYEVEPLDPMTFILTTSVLTVVALAAALLPAWRATRVDPVECLRSE